MFQYEDLMWLISFPLVCAVMLWFSLDLAVLVRVGGGRRRRANARRAIERLILHSPVCGTVSVVQSPSPLSTPVAGHHDRSGRLDRSNGSESSPPTPNSHAQHFQKVRQVAVPAALRIATRAVVRRAVVMVGGDFARSPRMQYHAASLARSGLFDEVLLVGLDCGNQLSEDLLASGEPQPERFVTCEGPTRGTEVAIYDVEERLSSPEVQPGHGCIISTRYLASPPTPPEWLQAVFPLRSLHWVVCTLYRVAALTLRFVVQLGRVTATRINEHGQLLVTDVILVQTPPAVPFVLLVKYVVCPLAFVYNMLLYYCVVVPAAWMNPDAMKDLRRECRLQSLRFTAEGGGGGNAKAHAAAPSTNGKIAALSLSSLSVAATAAATGMAASAAGGLLPTRALLRPWVFYPAVAVDWHNFGYTILEQNQRPTTAVQLYKLLEVHLCAGCVNVTVSHAMRRALEGFYPRFAAKQAADCVKKKQSATSVPEASPRAVTVLYDVAPSFFRPVSRRRCVREVLDRLLRRHQATPPSSSSPAVTLNPTGEAAVGAYTLVSMSELEAAGWGIAGPPAWVYADAAAEAPSSPQGSPSSPTAPSSVFGLYGGGAATARRGVVLVGSTSWTEDDDYTVLIRALRRLDHRLNHEGRAYSCSGNAGPSSATTAAGNGATAPMDLWVLITGKGPARQRFETAVRAAKLSSRVVVSTYYAQSFQEYSVLLGAADVGFCLHFSSSGWDLPMKGVDMVGAGLPVVALQYPAIEELMGGATRVLAQTRSIPRHNVNGGGSSSSSSSSSNGAAAPPSLVECERGWVFKGDVELEALLSSFVGLPPITGAAALIDGGGRGSAVLTPTPLSVMRRKAQEARQHAATWSDNWTRVLLPVLKQVV